LIKRGVAAAAGLPFLSEGKENDLSVLTTALSTVGLDYRTVKECHSGGVDNITLHAHYSYGLLTSLPLFGYSLSLSTQWWLLLSLVFYPG